MADKVANSARGVPESSDSRNVAVPDPIFKYCLTSLSVSDWKGWFRADSFNAVYLSRVAVFSTT
jgi:hypothetical protein